MTAKSANPAFAFLSSVKAMEDAITSIHTTGSTLQTLMHQTACSVLRHIGKHGDVRLLMKLVNAMPDMARKNSLILWAETFGPVKFDGKVFVFVKDKSVKLADATAKPFWKFKVNEGASYEPLDIYKYIDQQIKRLTKDSEKTTADHSALISALRSVRAGIKPTFEPAH